MNTFLPNLRFSGRQTNSYESSQRPIVSARKGEDLWTMFAGRTLFANGPIKVKQITWAVLGSLIWSIARAASFPCNTASNAVEKMICNDTELSRLDVDMSNTYRRVLTLSDDKQWTRHEQAEWMREARNLCNDLACTRNAYLHRINELESEEVYYGAHTLATPQLKRMPPKRHTLAPPVAPSPIVRTTLCTPASRCERVALLYSEDDAICKPLLRIYQRLWEKDEKERNYTPRTPDHPGTKGYWEDNYSSAFMKAGFVTPQPLQDKEHNFVTPSIGGGAIAFYRLRLDKNLDEQTVLVRDRDWASHGDYSSDVYVSRPGLDISTCTGEYFVSFTSNCRSCCPPDAPTYNQLALATNLGFYGDSNNVHADTLVAHEYYFDKGSTAQKFSKVISGEVIPVDVGIWSGAPVIQRLYLFKGQSIFTANQLGTAVAYRIINGNNMDDICYFATNVAKISH